MSEVAIPHAAVPWSGTSARPADRGQAIDRLPGGGELDPFDRLVMAFLVGYPSSTARAYLTDLKAWRQACTQLAVHPFDARRHHVDIWIRLLSTQPLPRTGRPMASASIARRLSAVSAFYDYGISVEALDFSPVANARRPRVSEETTTVGLSADEAGQLLDVAQAHSPRAAALISLLTYNGVRIAEALSADLSDYTFHKGHRVLRIVGKGGKTATTPLNPIVVRAIDRYLEQGHAGGGALFRDRTGTTRLAAKTASDMIGRLARKAALPAAERITPHSFRHTFITEALAAGVPLQEVQDAAGHADPRTTRRYDHGRNNLDKHPTYVLAGHFRRRTDTDG